MSDAALVVGLGNPGPEYERTRHNVGFRVVDILADRLVARLKPVRGLPGLGATGRDGDRQLILAQPTTFMNLSGDAVREFARYYKVGREDIVVVHDELDLPFGQIRVKRGGGDAGHNGLKHITRALGSPDYARVRLGIGRPPGRMKGADYVLKPFAKAELDEVEVMLQEAADATLLVVRDGLEAAQQRYHASEPKQPKEQRAIRAKVVVRASEREAFDAWTTVEGVTSFFAPAARIELQPRGAYELYFDPDQPPGRQGSEGCTVVAFEPGRYLVFTWNAPPSMPSVREGRATRVEIRFEPASGGTKVSLVHSGWGKGAEWDEAFAYFERTWPTVLARLERRFREGPADWTG